MTKTNEQVIIFYDGVCPVCQRYRRFYEYITSQKDKHITWFDITNEHTHLKRLGISHNEAEQELHLMLPNGELLVALDAYLFLLRRISWLKSVAWLLALPFIRPVFMKYYRFSVNRRLKKSGRR